MKPLRANIKDITGHRFGRLSCLYLRGSNTMGASVWYCACDCGEKKFVLAQDMKSGRTKSCGCLGRELGRRKPL